jgi:hypothetical protein
MKPYTNYGPRLHSEITDAYLQIHGIVLLSAVLRNLDLFLEIVRSILYSSDIQKDCNTGLNICKGQNSTQ